MGKETIDVSLLMFRFPLLVLPHVVPIPFIPFRRVSLIHTAGSKCRHAASDKSQKNGPPHIPEATMVEVKHLVSRGNN
jgi:hypothetical protein